MAFFTNIINSFGHGGMVMWVIFAGQIVSIAIMIERGIALYLKRDKQNKAIVDGFEDDIKLGRMDRVIHKAQKLSEQGNALGQAILVGAQTAQNEGGREEIQSKMDEVLLKETSIVEKRTGFLAALGNIGTLAGLLGTIIGLIGSFEAVATSNPTEKAALLSSGISMAMHATAYGLIMAIPALVMFAVFQNRAQELNEDLAQNALKAFNWLSFNYDSRATNMTKPTKGSSARSLDN